MTSALAYRDVVKRYGRRRALDGLTVDVPAGCVCGLVGANGAGKTTALAVAAGLGRIHSGSVSIFGGGGFDPARHSGRVTLLPQDAELPREARPAELLTFYGETQGLTRSDARAEARRLMEAVHLTDRDRSPMRVLSHGMRKRVMIAQCFIGSPDLVLLDEPLSGLDPIEAARARRLMDLLRGRQTVIVSSHNLSEIERMCDHVVFMDHGRCVRSGSLDEITRRAQCLIYALDRPPPLDRLQAQCPDMAFEWSASDLRLTCRFESGWAIERVNAAVLPLLIGENIGLRSVEPGERLESEYLRHAGA
ncbi:MAG: ABC transporter ATP-binding protein [Kiritimatiellae bacterium]|nr:ABC transporter ATP-binding protein [Kiritimatiellia bacterium]